MKINEVASSPSSNQLTGLADFLAGRAKDTNGPKQIDKATFTELAGNLGIVLSTDQLADMISKPPMSNLFEPVDPNSDKLMFKGAEQPAAGMPVNKAQDVVAAAAKKAMNKDRSV